MEVLSCKELGNISGGGKSLWYVIGGALTLLAGIIAGFVNPRKCN